MTMTDWLAWWWDCAGLGGASSCRSLLKGVLRIAASESSLQFQTAGCAVAAVSERHTVLICALPCTQLLT